MKLAPLTEPTRRDHIARSLRDMIVSGAVPAGERLTESELAGELGVSRAPLREAIRELVSDGLLISQPYRGLFVRSFTRKDLEELYSLRTTLERMAFREAWDRRTPEALADLEARHAALIVAADAGDAAAGIERELALHGWCFETSGHGLLIDVWRRIRPNLQFYLMLHQRAHARPGPRRDAHRTYVAHAMGDDLQAMQDHLEDHLRQGLERTLAYIEADEQGTGARPDAGKSIES